MRILGVDPGITTGFALIECDGGERWSLIRRWDFRPECSSRGGALAILRNELSLWLYRSNSLAADLAAMEAFRAYGTNTAEEKVEAQAIVKLEAWLCDVDLHEYAPVTVRSTIMGHGKAKPAEIKATLRHLLGMGRSNPKGSAFSPHQCDALAVALCCALKEGYLSTLSPLS